MKECLYIPELETERLLLRKLTAADAEDLREWFGLDEVYTYWGRPASKGEKNPEELFVDARPWVKRKPSHDFIWGMELKSTGKVIGMLEIFDVENDRMGHVGYRVAPRCWGQGLCTEALRRAVAFIFEETKLDRLEVTADVRNTGSNRVLEKCGFRLEGTVRHGKMGTRYCDYHIWGLIRDDLAAQP
ncbi:MAG: GNAT family N-acetyltransferase [Clostridia bacterium]|nr:GNAT family N-acetyltransferase [Clostridia bacterium]